MESKRRIPRKLKKALGKSIITLDISAVPRGMDIEQWLHIIQTTGMAVYDSARGQRPTILKGKSKRIKVIST